MVRTQVHDFTLELDENWISKHKNSGQMTVKYYQHNWNDFIEYINIYTEPIDTEINPAIRACLYKYWKIYP